jgi:hypothetical protein
METAIPRAVPLYRPKGSKDHDVWFYDQRIAAMESCDQLAIAVRAESPEDFQLVWKYSTDHRWFPDTAIGSDV